MRLTGSFHTMVRQGRAGSRSCCWVSSGTTTGPGVVPTIPPAYALRGRPHVPVAREGPAGVPAGPPVEGAPAPASRQRLWSHPVTPAANNRHDQRDHQDGDTDPDEDLRGFDGDADDEHDHAENDENQPQGHACSLRSRCRPAPAVALIVANLVQLGTSRARSIHHQLMCSPPTAHLPSTAQLSPTAQLSSASSAREPPRSEERRVGKEWRRRASP